ncbi:ABC transporter permease [Bradyrhizobium huanghuaihaiense]|uniref:ABC transporter permease n=1 Tax=Bradyrhizobium huanghuaihaiense TaxID=990078 RepID=UPI0021AAF6D7|nr:ABC transporter permease [Bradyrhizobium sp. CB3035]UWU74160.1 ABC transporter permease [Bradyrhizobium sp. CB3035]
MGAAPASRDVTSYGMGLAAPLALFFLLFFVAPLLQLLWLSLHNDTAGLHWGLGQYLHFLTDPFSLGVLGSTLLLGAEVTAVCLVLGFPIAWLYQRVGPKLQTIIILIVLLPLLTSVVVRTFAWIVILGRQGIINATLQSLGIIDTPLKLLYTQFGVVIALAQVQMPLMTLPLITALGRIDPNLDDASCSLGAGSWRTFFRIVLPLSLPGVIAGCTLTYAAAITAFITQSLIGGGQMLFMPMYLYQQASTLQNWPFAAAISIIFLLAVLAVVSVFTTLGRMSRGYGGA